MVAILALAVLAGAQSFWIAREWGNRSEPGAGRQVAAEANAPRKPLPVATTGSSTSSGGRPAATTGRLQVRTEPAGGEVILDGKSVGRAPVTLDALPPGKHEIIIQGRSGRTRHPIEVQAGELVSLAIPLAAPAAAASREGWLMIRAPFEMEVREGDRRLGTSDARLGIGQGRRRLTLVNEDLGFEQEQAVTMVAGKTVTLTPRIPRRPIAINATPWAEVWVDGEPAGETPIGQLNLSLGAHVLVLRHPELGEKRVQVVVRATGEPDPVSVDMRR